MTKSTIFSTIILHAFCIAAAAAAAGGGDERATIIHPVEANGNNYEPNTPSFFPTTYAPTPDDDTTPPITPFPTEAIIPVSYNIKLIL
jgi:hypothetical protein